MAVERAVVPDRESGDERLERRLDRDPLIGRVALEAGRLDVRGLPQVDVTPTVDSVTGTVQGAVDGVTGTVDTTVDSVTQPIQDATGVKLP